MDVDPICNEETVVIITSGFVFISRIFHISQSKYIVI
jgi:hypothetical protein